MLNILHIVFIFLPVRHIQPSFAIRMLTPKVQKSVFHVPLTNSSYVVWISEPLSVFLDAHALLLTCAYFSLTVILVSRFMLDLHEAHRALAHQGSSELDMSTIQIMSLDIGGPYPQDPECEDLQDLSATSNLNLSFSEPEGGSWSRVSVNACIWLSTGMLDAIGIGRISTISCFLDRPARLSLYRTGPWKACSSSVDWGRIVETGVLLAV